MDYDVHHPKRFLPREDFENFLPQPEDNPWWVRTNELIACASEQNIPRIDAALDEETKKEFWKSVLDMEVSRRLGTLHRAQGITGMYLLDGVWLERFENTVRWHLERSPEMLREQLDERVLLRCAVLMRNGFPAGFSRLWTAALGDDPVLRAEALPGLHASGCAIDQVEPMLRSALQNPRPAVRLRALEALLALAGEQPPMVLERQLLELLAEYPQEEFERLFPWKCTGDSAFSTLFHRMGVHERVRAFLFDALQRPKHQQQEAAFLVASLGPLLPELFPSLLSIAKNGSAWCFRLLGAFGEVAREPLLVLWHSEKFLPADRDLLAVSLLKSDPKAEHSIAPAIEWLDARLVLEPDLLPQIYAVLTSVDHQHAKPFLRGQTLEDAVLSMLTSTPERVIAQSQLVKHCLRNRQFRDGVAELMRENERDFRALEGDFWDAVTKEEPERLLLLRERLGTADSVFAVEALLTCAGWLAKGEGSGAYALLMERLLSGEDGVFGQCLCARGIFESGRTDDWERLGPLKNSASAVLRAWWCVFSGGVGNVGADDPSPVVRWVREHSRSV